MDFSFKQKQNQFMEQKTGDSLQIQRALLVCKNAFNLPFPKVVKLALSVEGLEVGKFHDVEVLLEQSS